MNEPRGSVAVRLIRLARRRCEELGGRLGELERSRVDLAFAIRAIDDAVDTERNAISAADPVGIVDLARFEAAALTKRAALVASSGAMSAEIERLRQSLADAFAELKKLEHVADLSLQAMRRRQAGRDLAALDEAARLRFTARP